MAGAGTCGLVPQAALCFLFRLMSTFDFLIFSMISKISIIVIDFTLSFSVIFIKKILRLLFIVYIQFNSVLNI